MKKALRPLFLLLWAVALQAQTVEKVVFAHAVLTLNSTWGPGAVNARSYLRVIDADGLHEQDLKLVGVNPAVSPDAARIAYCSNPNSFGYELWIADLTGGHAHRLLEVKNGSACEPSWSPDGKSLALVLYQEKADPMIAIIAPDGSGLRQVVPGRHPSWSAHGDKLAFEEWDAASKDRHLRVATINVDGTGKTVLVGGDSNNFQPAWSPDGARIAFVSDRNEMCSIYVSSADGTGSLHRMLFTEKGQLANPAWFADGERIAYEWSYRTSGMGNSKAHCSGGPFHFIAIANLSGSSHLTNKTAGMHPAVVSVAATK